MPFKDAVIATPHLEHAWKAGLGALRAQDRSHIQPEDTRLLRGSVDVDSTLQQFEPHAHRWDFAIGYQHSNKSTERIYWVEIHTASDGQIKVVLDKLRWLQNWLKTEGKSMASFEREFIWVSSGATSFTRTSPQQKQLAMLGLQHKGSVLHIPKVCSN